MTPEEFLEARIQEMESYFKDLTISYYHKVTTETLISNMRALIDLHKNWPVLVQSEPVFDDEEINTDNIVYRVTQNFEWYSQEAYRKKFGSEPPTAPMIRKMLEPWPNHPDFDPSWL